LKTSSNRVKWGWCFRYLIPVGFKAAGALPIPVVARMADQAGNVAGGVIAGIDIVNWIGPAALERLLGPTWYQELKKHGEKAYHALLGQYDKSHLLELSNDKYLDYLLFHVLESTDSHDTLVIFLTFIFQVMFHINVPAFKADIDKKKATFFYKLTSAFRTTTSHESQKLIKQRIQSGSMHPFYMPPIYTYQFIPCVIPNFESKENAEELKKAFDRIPNLAKDYETDMSFGLALSYLFFTFKRYLDLIVSEKGKTTLDKTLFETFLISKDKEDTTPLQKWLTFYDIAQILQTDHNDFRGKKPLRSGTIQLALQAISVPIAGAMNSISSALAARVPATVSSGFRSFISSHARVHPESEAQETIRNRDTLFFEVFKKSVKENQRGVGGKTKGESANSLILSLFRIFIEIKESTHLDKHVIIVKLKVGQDKPSKQYFMTLYDALC
jgi:hypothetical protein